MTIAKNTTNKKQASIFARLLRMPLDSNAMQWAFGVLIALTVDSYARAEGLFRARLKTLMVQISSRARKLLIPMRILMLLYPESVMKA